MSAPSTQDIQTPIDPTGYASISGSQLLQILSSLTPYLDKGFAIVTTDVAGNPEVPNANTNTQWQRFLWIRQSVTSVGLYVWNTAAAIDATYLKWQSINIAGIGAGSIVNNMIADNTIQSIKIVSLDWSKITGAPTGLAPTGAAGGDLTGNFPNPSVGAGVITSAKIAAKTIVPANIADASLTLALDAPVSGSAKDMARVNAGATGMEAFTPPVLFTSGVVVPTANALKIPQVNAGATDFQMVASTTLGRVLQVVETQDNTADTTALNCTLATLPTTANTKQPAGLQQAITPISATSTLLVEVEMFLGVGGADGVVALFQDAGANAIAAASNAAGAAITSPVQCILRYKVVSGSLTARTFKAGFAGNTGNTRYNSTDGATKMFGGALGVFSWIRITEYI